MTKLHELLAVEGDLAGKAKRIFKQTKELFGNPGKFIGQSRTYQPLDDEGQPFPPEITNVSTTVDNELSKVQSAFGSWLDVSLQKEMTNRSTSADVEVDGETLFTGLPSTVLLNMESKLSDLRSVLSSIPTNDTTDVWTEDEQTGYYVSDPRYTFRTEKSVESIVGSEPTEHHPAQIQWFNVDTRVGEWTTIVRSGQYQPAEKVALLDRLDKLILAVKKARQRANNVEIDTTRFSTVLAKYLWV